MTHIDELLLRAQKDCAPLFERLEATEEHNSARVLSAFQFHGIAARHFAGSSGYGYDDVGRDTLEKLCAHVFHAEEAICRPQLSGGTATLALCLFAILRPGDRLLCATGKPYDTLDTTLGLNNEENSLKELLIETDIVPLNAQGGMDTPAILNALRPDTRLVLFQRSRGYALRSAFSPKEMKPVFEEIKKKAPEVFIMVDNCYGAFVNEDEPCFYGADLCAGSLIKNLGGGLAPTGGYIAGSKRAISRVEARLTAPGLGREVGSYEPGYRAFYQGLLMAPHTVCQALKTAVLTARMAELMGYEASPAYDAPRSDIIQALVLKDAESVKAYCRGIQAASPIDSFAAPEPWDMPGYQDQVIMAAGAFVQGASIELSCDAPMRPPFAVYQQGGLSYALGKAAVKSAFQALSQVRG